MGSLLLRVPQGLRMENHLLHFSTWLKLETVGLVILPTNLLGFHMVRTVPFRNEALNNNKNSLKAFPGSCCGVSVVTECRGGEYSLFFFSHLNTSSRMAVAQPYPDFCSLFCRSTNSHTELLCGKKRMIGKNWLQWRCKANWTPQWKLLPFPLGFGQLSGTGIQVNFCSPEHYYTWKREREDEEQMMHKWTEPFKRTGSVLAKANGKRGECVQVGVTVGDQRNLLIWSPSERKRSPGWFRDNIFHCGSCHRLGRSLAGSTKTGVSSVLGIYAVSWEEDVFPLCV